MPDEIYGVMAVKNGQKQTIMNLSNARQKSYADLQTMTDAQKKGVIVCPDYPKEEFLVTANEVSYGSGTVKEALDGLNKSFTKLQSSGQFVSIPAEAKEFFCYVKNSLSSDPQYVGYFNVEVLDMAQLNTVWFSDIYYYRYNKPSFSITSRRSGSNYDAEYMIIYWR